LGKIGENGFKNWEKWGKLEDPLSFNQQKKGWQEFAGQF
jgi:hypothetical protein